MYKNRTAFTLVEFSIVVLIVGIITTGVTQSSRLIGSFRLSSARNLTQNAPVANIEGLVAWWESTAESSLLDRETNDGSQISTWNDLNPQTTNKYNITQSTAANKPTYATSAINGLPALKFNGTSQFLEATYKSEFNPSTFTIFAVVQPLGSATNGAILSSTDLTNKGYTLYLTSGLRYQTWLGINNTSWQGTAISGTASLKKTDIITSTYNSNNVYNLFDNGVLQGSASYSPFITNTQRPLRIGAARNNATPSFFFNGYIGEIILFSRCLKVEERLAVETYLKKKWGIS